MKKYIYILSVMMIFSSCEDFLETSSPSSLSVETVYETTSLTEAAIMGIYSKMTDTYIYGQKLSVNWQGHTDIESNGSFSSDTYRANTSDSGAGNYYDNPANQTTQWQALFQMAELASTAVEGIRNSPILETSPELMYAYLGEALTLRALAYFELVRYWGDVPFKSEPSNSDLSNVYTGRVDRDQAYAQMVKDLQEAVDYVPWLGDHPSFSTSERVTKGFVKGLLARVALFAGGWSLRDGNTFPNLDVEHHPEIPELSGFFVGRSKNWLSYYEIAAQQCAEMIGSAESPHDLDPSYENVWKTVCGLGQNPSNENLFEVAFGVGNNGDIGSLMGYNVSGNSKYGTRGFGGSYVTSTAYYFYSFDRDDLRRDVTLSWFNYTSDNKEDLSTDPLNVKFAKWRIYWMSDGYLNLHKTASGRIGTGVNWILMRYSDILLMYAEAMNQLQGPDGMHAEAGITARQALEKVRERAFGLGSAKVAEYDDDFFQAIVNERAWEFGCESIRKQDLVRWGLLSSKIEDMKTSLCLMFDKQAVQIFDKTYDAGSFPNTIYYTYQDEEFIDPTSINFYTELGADPGGDYESKDWFPKSAEKPLEGNNENYKNWPVRTLLAASGLNASYDYSGFLSGLSNGPEIYNTLIGFPMGNNITNYNHLFSIFHEDVTESKGYLENVVEIK